MLAVVRFDCKRPAINQPKSSLFNEDLRLTEQDKIRCGEAHFAALDSSVKYGRATKAEQLAAWQMKGICLAFLRGRGLTGT